MPKWFPITWLLKTRVTVHVWIILSLIAVIQFFASYGVYKYLHIPEENINEYLYKHVNPKLKLTNSKGTCNYEYILQSSSSLNNLEIPTQRNDFTSKGIVNGSYSPEDCNPLFSVAVLVTYRNRKSQLDIFIPYMHNFLRKQNIHYKIFVIEQLDDKPWNKGLLYNIGVKQAIAEKFQCLILHDVDLLPLDESNLYACLKQPRHMSASIDKFRYVLIYQTLVGGVLALTSDHYQQLDGFSNKFQGWGGEDDDLARRILTNKLSIWRFPQHMSRYTMLLHRQEPKNTARYDIITENEKSNGNDGYKSAHCESVDTQPLALYTLLQVRI